MNGWSLVSAALRATKENRNDVVQSIERLIETGAWRSFTTPNGELIEPASLKDFIEAQPNHGLGLGVQTLVSLLEDTNLPESASKVRLAVLDDLPAANPHGGDRKSEQDGVTNLIGEANDAGYVVSRLKRDNPDLAAAVVQGNVSPNAAAVAAGIRHKYARIRTDNVERAVAKLVEVYDRNEVLIALGVKA